MRWYKDRKKTRISSFFSSNYLKFANNRDKLKTEYYEKLEKDDGGNGYAVDCNG